MSRPGSRKLAALLAMAWAIAQPGARSPLLAGVWSFGDGEDGPAHSLALEADAGHVDLVVSHAHEKDCERGGSLPALDRANRPADLACCQASDHVVHLAVDPAARETGQAQPVTLQSAPMLRLAVAPPSAGVRAPRSIAGAVDLLRTVVLRA